MLVASGVFPPAAARKERFYFFGFGGLRPKPKKRTSFSTLPQAKISGSGRDHHRH